MFDFCPPPPPPLRILGHTTGYLSLSDKYDIWPINWTKSFSIVLRKLYDYVDKHVYSANEATLIRDLFIKLDSGDFRFFNIDELNEMVVLLCTA